MNPQSNSGQSKGDDEAAHRLRTIREVFENGEWVDAERLRALQRPVADWEREGRVFAVDHEGRRYFASYQFAASMVPLPVIKEVLAAFGEADPWVIAAWFHFPSAWLVQRDEHGARNVSPKDVLDRGPEVVSAAAKRLSSWVA